MDQDKKAYRQNICVAIIIMVFAAAVFLLSLPMPDHAPVFPRMASAFLFLCGAALLGNSIKNNKNGTEQDTPPVDFSTMQSPLGVLLLVLFYAIGFKYIGFYVTTLVVVIAFMLYMGIRSVKTIALVTGVLLVFLYWLFTIQLGVPMPLALLM